MGAIRAGQLTAFFLFDVAEAADLAGVQALVGSAGQPVQLVRSPTLPADVEYQAPPVVLDSVALGLPRIDGY